MKTSPPNQIFLKALTLIEYDRPKEAIPLLSKFLAQEPDNYEALCYLSSCFGAITEKEKCLHYANQAIQLNPNDAWGYQLQSMAFSELGKYQAGLSAAQAAMRISPQSQSSLTTLMRSYIDCEMLKEAWQTGKKLRSMFPDNAKVFVDIGYILINKKRFDQAEWYLKESLKLDPHCWMNLNNLAVVYENKKMPAKALEY